MKIGMVSEFYYPHPGGVSEHIRSISLCLQSRGHEVIVISGGMPSGLEEPGPRVLRLGKSLPLRYNGSLSRVTTGIGLDARMRKVLREERFDLLHLHNPLMPVLPHLALRRAECPVVATLHSGYPRDRWAEFFRRPLGRLLSRVERFLPVSVSAQRAVEPLFAGRHQIVPNGVDYDFFAEARPLSASFSRARLRLLFVGAIVPRKGLPVLLRAFAQLRQRRHDVELWVVGDGPDLPRARRLVPERLRPDVHFLGSCGRRAVRAAYGLTDLFIAPSLGRESFGMVLLEAMAAGLPVIASEIDGYREVVDPGKDGLLLAPGDPQALAEAIEYVSTDGSLQERLARAGRVKAAGMRWSSIASRLEAVYAEVTGIPAPAPGLLCTAPATPAPKLVGAGEHRGPV